MYIEKSFFFYGFTRSEMAVIAMRVNARRSNLNRSGGREHRKIDCFADQKSAVAVGLLAMTRLPDGVKLLIDLQVIWL
jgi:REP element-mobilizing transposase RayT